MAEAPKKPRPQNPNEQPTVSAGGVFVGILLFIMSIWALWAEKMVFAYLTVTLLAILAIGNYLINMKYS